MADQDLYVRLLNASPSASPRSFEEWSVLAESTLALSRSDASASLDAAVVMGHSCDCIGYAFASGYYSALHSLLVRNGSRSQVERVGRSKMAFCASESPGGAHPKAIRTMLSRNGDGTLIMNGRKTFVTFGFDADLLLVVAVDGRLRLTATPSLVVLCVSRQAKGITMETRPALPFIPEVPHSVVTFTNVVVSEQDILPGDGYTAYLRPFRTVEDVHVFGAILGYAVRVAKERAWSALLERLLVLLASLRGLAVRNPSDPVTHVMLGGFIHMVPEQLAEFERLLGACSDQAGQSRYKEWMRDKRVLTIASKARQKRTDSAWAKL